MTGDAVLQLKVIRFCLSDRRRSIQHTVVTPGYFRTMGIPLLAGRDFTDADAKDSPDVTIVDERLARRVLAQRESRSESAFVLDHRKITNRGTRSSASSARSGINECRKTRDKSVYLPHQKIPVTGMALVARTSSNPTEFAGAIRREVAQLDPDLPVSEIATMEEVVAESIWQPRLYAMLFAVFAGGALAVGADRDLWRDGVSGADANTRDRCAHGAGRDRARCFQADCRTRNEVDCGWGRDWRWRSDSVDALMHSLLFNTSATDPITFILISVLLSFAAFFACYIPARRAAKVDPLIALRYEYNSTNSLCNP